MTEEQTGTLVAQDHGHHPAVLQAAGFSTEHSAQSRSIGYEEEMSPTLRAGVVPAAMAIENHPTDSRVKIAEDGKVQTLTERMGTGGGNVPLVAEPEPITMKIRGGREGGGKGILCQVDKSATLGCNNDQTLFQPDIKAFGVCSKASHAMMSDNPHSGFYEAETSRTLDCNGGRPDCSQGGMRHRLQAQYPDYCSKVQFYVGDVRNLDSVRDAMYGADYVFHAAALKEVPSCEFFPMAVTAIAR